MARYKKDVNTTSPVAIQQGQSDYHVPGQEPWHINATTVACPACDVVYIVDQGFAHQVLLLQLKTDHENNKNHAPFIASEPAFTTVTNCQCK